MKGEDKVIIGIVIVAFTTFIGVAFYTGGHTTGYQKGIWHSQIYYQATGAFPTEDWVIAHEDDHFNYVEQIRETLIPFSK